MKSEKGITLITLSITIIVLIILTTTMSINAPQFGEKNKKNKFENDIESLKEEIDQYYARNKTIPVINKYTNTSMLEKNVNDNDNYYVIDISKLNVKLNYGEDYEQIKLKDITEEITNVADVYIINEQSHTIYYPKGIYYYGEIHYTIYNEYNLIENKIFERNILLDVARRYYTVDEIKKYIDIVSTYENSCFQMHFTDDQNVGIECVYLDQTESNATVEGNVYTNPLTEKKFLTYNQVKEIMEYCKLKKVTFIPEIDVPAHMKGFFDLARIKFGDDFVNNIARGVDREAGNIDIVQKESDEFIIALYDEYTELFKDCEYFHIGFDEYTYRIDEKIDYINRLYTYLKEKGFTVSMWNDSITTENIDKLNNDIRIAYWQYNGSGYATVQEFEDKGFKVSVTNSYYLFFVPSLTNTNEHDLQYMVDDITNNWTLDVWDATYKRELNNYDNIVGGLICVWGENSEGVENDIIVQQVKNMYNAMSEKLKINE